MGLLILATTIFNNIFQTAWETISIPPVASAEKFEKIFEELLNHVLGDSTNKRAVILIDELDRCDAKTRAEVLQGLRTYLQNDRCVYVVACALESLKPENNDQLTADEFLRKLFNLTYWIDPQREEDIRTYTAQRLKEAEFGDDNKLVQIIVLGNTKNPRRIRHFLNTLRFALKVASAREKAGKIPKGTVTDKKAFLAKILIIRQDWPEAFKEIVRKPLRLKQWTESESFDGIAQDIRWTESESVDRVAQELHRFLYKTSQFMEDDLRPFLAVTSGASERETEDQSKLVAALLNLNKEEAKSIVESEYRGKEAVWLEIVFKELRQFLQTKDDQFFTNVLIVACYLFQCVPTGQQQDYIDEVSRLMYHIHGPLPPQSADDVFPLVLKARSELRLRLLASYLKDFFESGKVNPAIGDAFEKHAQEISTNIRDALNQIVVQAWLQMMGGKPGDLRLLEAYSEWPKNEENIKYLVSPEIVKALMETYDQLAPEFKGRLYEVVCRLRPAWDDQVKKRVTDLLFKPFPDEESQTNLLSAEQSLSLDCIEKLLTIDDRAIASKAFAVHWPESSPYLLASDNLAIESGKALRLLWKNFQNLRHGDQPYNDKVNQMVKVALRLNPLPPAETLPDLRSILNHYAHKFTDQFPLLCLRLRSEPKFDQAEERLVAFLTSTLTEEKYSADLKPDSASAFISALFSIGRWVEINDCLKRIGQSVDWDSLLTTCAILSVQHDQLNLEPLIEMLKEYGGADRFASCEQFLLIVANWCPDLGASSDKHKIYFGRYLFDEFFQFIPDSIKRKFAEKYTTVRESRAGELTEDNAEFIKWAKEIWHYSTFESQNLTLEKLGYLSRPEASYHLQDIADQVLRDVIALLDNSAQRTETLSVWMKELIDMSQKPSSDYAACLRTAAKIQVLTGIKIDELEDRIQKLETSDDANFKHRAKEIRTILSQSKPL